MVNKLDIIKIRSALAEVRTSDNFGCHEEVFKELDSLSQDIIDMKSGLKFINEARKDELEDTDDIIGDTL